MNGFDFSTARDASIWTVAGAILLALIAVWVVKAVVTKVLTVVILLAVAGVVWSQREELLECADEVQATVDNSLANDTTCTFFGRDVTIPGRASLIDDNLPGGGAWNGGFRPTAGG